MAQKRLEPKYKIGDVLEAEHLGRIEIIGITDSMYKVKNEIAEDYLIISHIDNSNNWHLIN